MDELVTTAWLAEALGSDGLLLLDASYTATLPGTPPRDPLAGYREAHIPGARFLDLDALADPDSALPSMLPPRERFGERMEALGVGAARQIVLYDAGPHHTAFRAWWVLRMFGVTAAVLDGGLAKWRAENLPLASGDEAPVAAPFVPGEPLAAVRTLAEMRDNVERGAEQVVDARSSARFTGEEGDPRGDVAAGHIPGSRNLPSATLFAADGTFKRGAALEAAFAAAGIDPARPLVATCGSGITAAILVFGAHLLGHQAALYDGSWSEWGSDPATPKALGPA